MKTQQIFILALLVLGFSNIAKAGRPEDKKKRPAPPIKLEAVSGNRVDITRGQKYYSFKCTPNSVSTCYYKIVVNTPSLPGDTTNPGCPVTELDPKNWPHTFEEDGIYIGVIDDGVITYYHTDNLEQTESPDGAGCQVNMTLK
jgi:hypothetical protein